jgi:RimJ/RimL family protein N-acetyltransferase
MLVRGLYEVERRKKSRSQGLYESATLRRMVESLVTDRLILRRWREEDREPFQAINADPRVMEFFPALLMPKESDEAIARIEQHFERHGFGLYAAELIEAKTFIGFIGLSVPGFDAPFMPAVEIGWRLAYAHWGRGLATEGARALVRHAFETLRLPSLVSFTSTANLRSRRVMENIGMVHDPAADFDHPRIPEGHPLRRHVLYRLHSPGDIAGT